MKELSSRMQSKRETERHISGASTNLNCYIQSQMAELIMQSNLYYIYISYCCISVANSVFINYYGISETYAQITIFSLNRTGWRVAAAY